jgi:UPF0755 protein
MHSTRIMYFHQRHFPTFIRHGRRLWQWYQARAWWERTAVDALCSIVAVAIVYAAFFSAPIQFPAGAYIEVKRGETLSHIATEFEDRGVVRYSFLLKVAIGVLGDQHTIPAGEYYFPVPENAVLVAIRLASGDFEITPIKVMIPEGATIREIAALLLKKIPNFNVQEFLRTTQGREGYLFPDTYFFMPGDSTEAILSVFNNDFRVQMLKVQKEISASKKTLPDILTMASLLQKEAAGSKDRQLVAGVLWRRIAIGMPLQVDAVFPYILGKPAAQLTHADLAVDSLYNTYTHKGLPPGPIGNPSLDAIRAAATPTITNYLYYLSDSNSNLYFCVTYACQQSNIRKYLGN